MTEGALARHQWARDKTDRAPDQTDQPRRNPAGTGNERPLVLIADDEAPVLRVLERIATRVGFDVVTCSAGQDALRAMRERTPDLALVDLRMPDLSGMDVLRQFRGEVSACPVVIITAYGAIESAVEAMKLGAREYLTKPFDFARLRALLEDVRDERQPSGSRRPEVGEAPDLCALLGATPVVQEVSALVRSLASSARVVLVSGERGSGQELVARTFHQCGPRANKPFVTISCSALVDSLFERKLFGHERGAFLGAEGSAPGLFEVAHGGTVFFDDVGDLPLAVQGMLVQTLETGTIQRVGAERPRMVDVTIVAATQRDLRADVAAGRFRADLYYRLSVVGIGLPPLRERRDDIPLLAIGWLRECALTLGTLLVGFTDDAMTTLREAPWDGNLQELRTCVERACAVAAGPLVTADDVAVAFRGEPRVTTPRGGGLHVVRSGGTPAPLQDVEKEHILTVLRDVRGNRMAAAKVLGISRRALYRRLARHRISGGTLHAVPPRGDDHR
ncbi:MAG: sigma-54-dependent Fis family transcriptional regulator [Acidimicrobiia bacterium]|nr:sigma-54-dependent Fis family transcriptional regulator [Acidimicrobiia bacterium]